MPVGTMGQKAPNVFDAARRRAEQSSTMDAQKNSEALQRRFASLGASNSGAAIKAEQTARDESVAKRESAMENINAAEAQDIAQKEERQVDRDFQAQQAKVGREFQAGETELQRGFQREQSGIDRAFQDKVFSFDKESKLKQLDLSFQQLDLAKSESDFNRRMAERTQGWNEDNQGGFFGAGGTLGLGLGF